MLTDFETFKKALLDSGYKVFRDQAPKEYTISVSYLFVYWRNSKMGFK